MEKAMEDDNPIQVVVFDLSTSAYVDSGGARLIKKLYYDLSELGITLAIAEAHAEVRDILRVEGIEHLLGHISRKHSLHEIVENCLEEHIKNQRNQMQSIDPAFQI
jgi:anti-anti-sigma regulatory factor